MSHGTAQPFVTLPVAVVALIRLARLFAKPAALSRPD
jgi:hypothetical protein